MKRTCPACLKHIASAVFALAVLLLSLEAGLRIYDGRTGRLSRNEEQVSPLLVPSSQTYHRLKPLTTVSIEHPDIQKPSPLTVNSLGLRGGEIAVPKPDGVYRVLMLGDESTFASETPLSETAAGKLTPLLQKHWNLRVEVINAGVPGYCPLLSYLLLKHSLLGLQPDLIVLNFDMSDVADDHRVRRLTRMGPDGEPLACRHPALIAGEDGPVKPRNRCLLFRWVCRQAGRWTMSQTDRHEADDIRSSQGRYAWVKDHAPDWETPIQQTFSAIGLLQALARKIGAEFVLAAVPAPWQVSATASNSASARDAVGIPRNRVYRNDRAFRLLAEFATEKQIPFCNPVAAFRRFPEADQLFLKNAPRFSRIGHELFARELAKRIVRDMLRPGSRGAAPPRSSRQFPPAFSTSHRRDRRSP